MTMAAVGAEQKMPNTVASIPNHRGGTHNEHQRSRKQSAGTAGTRRMQEELAAEVETIQDSLKAHMDAHSIDTLMGVDWKITWKSVVSTRIDTTTLRKTLPEVAERFTRETTTRRFCVV